MFKSATLLLSLAFAAPIQAAQPAASATVRSNYVYTFARQACPKDVELSKSPKNQHLEFLSDVAKSAHMSVEEANLLVMMCFIYQEGTRGETS